MKGAIDGLLLCAWLICLTSKRNFSRNDWMLYGKLKLHAGFGRYLLLQIGIFVFLLSVWLKIFFQACAGGFPGSLLCASSTFCLFRSLESYLYSVAGL